MILIYILNNYALKFLLDSHMPNNTIFHPIKNTSGKYGWNAFMP